MQPQTDSQPRHRLTDRQALAVIGGYFALRMITVRVGLFFLPSLLKHAPWSIPLLRNTLGAVITATAKVHRDPLLMVAVAAGSMFISMVAGLMLFWAGWRFGPLLAEKAAKQGSMWASVWNPKQVDRAHRFLERRGMIAVSLSRATNWIVTPVALVAGSGRMTFGKYVSAYGAGAVVWTAAALWLGVQAGTRWPWLVDRIEELSAWGLRIGLVTLVLFVVALLIGSRAQPGEDEKAEPQPQPEANG